MSIIAVARGLAGIVPGIARWLAGDKAGDVAEQAVEAARRIAGVDDPDEALSRIRKDPELQIRLQQAMAPVIEAQYEAEARQIAEINATIRAELVSRSAFKSGWRPAFGWAVVMTWLMQMVSVSYVIVTDVTESVKLINAMASLSFMWSLALGVLGINISKRSQDKMVAAGERPQTLLGAIVQRISGARNG